MTTIQLMVVALVLVATMVAWLGLERRRLSMEGRDAAQLADLANDAVMVADIVRGTILYANRAACEMLGYGRGELSDRLMSELHPGELSGRSAERIAEVWERKGLVYSDLPLLTKDGERIDVEISANLGRFHGQQAVLIYARDIRERLAAERRIREYAAELETRNRELHDTQEQLVQTEKLASLGNLAAGICHEINNPVGSIVANADVSRRALEAVAGAVPADDARVARSMRILEDLNSTTETAAQRIARIAKSLKSFAHLDESERKRQDVHQGIEDALVLAQHTFGDRITIDKHFAELPEVEHQPAQLNQVYMNVLINAVEAIEGSGTITIATERQGDEILIRFTDTGRGIPEAEIDRIFDPGFTTRGVGVGTGLGLPISYRIMQEHGGKIAVESEPGKGTTVTLRLPV